MSEVVVGVRIKADGTGLVGLLREAKAANDALTGSEKAGAAAARDMAQATGAAGAAAAGAANSTRVLSEAEKQASAALRENTQAVIASTTSLQALVAAAVAAGAANDGAATKTRGKAAADREAENAAKGSTRATRDQEKALREAERAANRAAFGARNLGQQFGDLGLSIAGGISPARAFGQQAGQIGYALSEMGGKAGKVGAFLTGPWGIALTVAAAVAAPFVEKLFEAGEAAKLAEVGANGLAQAQSVLGEIFNLTSGKLREQNDLLLLNARLTAINLRAEALNEKRTSDATFGNARRQSVFAQAQGSVRGALGLDGGVAGVFGAFRGAQAGTSRGARNASNLDNIYNNVKSGRLKPDEALRLSETQDYTDTKIDKTAFQQAIVDATSSEAKRQIADLIDSSLDKGELDKALRRDAPKGPKAKVDRSRQIADQLARFSEGASETVARISSEYDTAPKDVDRARAANAQLDKVIAEINRKLLTGKGLTKDQRAEFEAIKRSASDLRPIIEASLVKPIRDMLEAQGREIEIGKLRLAGREADAEALQLTYTLMDKLGAENEEQLATMLAQRGIRGEEVQQLYDNLDVMRQQTRELAAQQAKQQAFLQALGDVREDIRSTIADIVSGDGKIEDLFKRLKRTAANLFADVVTEQLFGGLFRDLQDQLTGGDQVSKAGKRMADAVDKAAKSGDGMAGTIDRANEAIGDLARAASGGAAAISGKGGAVPPGWIVGDDGVPFDPDAPIEVSGKKGSADAQVSALKSAFREGYEETMGGFTKSLKSLFGDVFGKGGLFSEGLGQTLGATLGSAFAASGVVQSIGGALGIKGSAAGSLIGGGAGYLAATQLGLMAGPLGALAGAAVGYLLPSLFKKAKTGSATITSAEDAATVSGNNGTRKEAALGLAGSVQDSLKQIADEFDGELGRFAVSIGIRDKNFRVDPTGRGNTKVKKGAVDFGDNEAGAIAYAVADAIRDGGITGLSAAIRQALSSSTDLQEALQEALKVRDVEDLLGGVGGVLKRQFREFEAQAKERVRIASQYGFDVLEIEKRNAEDRAKLVDEILASRVGSLQTLLDDFKFGNLADGSAADQLKALGEEIAKVRKDAEAGVDGSGDKLADLLRRRTELALDSFGTAGPEYAGASSEAISAAESVIKAENDRIKAAQDAATGTVTELKKSNDLADEANDYLARIAALLAAQGSVATSGGGSAISGAALRGLVGRNQEL